MHNDVKTFVFFKKQVIHIYSNIHRIQCISVRIDRYHGTMAASGEENSGGWGIRGGRDTYFSL